MSIKNLGESVYSLGVFIAVGLTKNYWLLIFLFYILISWEISHHKTNNERLEESYNLEMEKLREEIRILKLRKR